MFYEIEKKKETNEHMNLTKIMLQICPTKMSLNNILDIQEPILINDILPANENLSMLHILSETPGWIKCKMKLT